jgi:hypothetical protein
MVNYTTRDGLLSNSIKDIKITGIGIRIILFSGFLQKMHFGFRLVPTAATPLKVGAIYDLEEKDSLIMLATTNKFYKAGAAPSTTARVSTSVDYILVNGKDSAVGRSSFRHNENNLQINWRGDGFGGSNHGGGRDIAIAVFYFSNQFVDLRVIISRLS